MGLDPTWQRDVPTMADTPDITDKNIEPVIDLNHRVSKFLRNSLTRAKLLLVNIESIVYQIRPCSGRSRRRIGTRQGWFAGVVAALR